ncbi:hypothetical protein [Azohydromonas australica]|uniref:hypothetical protein n=1 Tax=Azohydromonas australica TaxID=364039 RepID=UPI0012EBC457|nr:hypothetical protein [Azohydromonas australica]
MFRITVTCKGLSESDVSEAVADMLFEFSQRPWQREVKCEWREAVLRLSAQSEGDLTGMALLDEFQDAVVAYINFTSEIHFEVESVVQL